MKKALVIILGLVIISSAIFLGYQILFPKEKIASLESIIPEDAIFYLYSYNPDKKIKDFQSSDFFKKISNSALYKKAVIPRLEKAKKKIPFLSELVKSDVALAIFSLGTVGSYRRDIVNFEDFLFLARINPKDYAKIKKSLADFYLSFVSQGKPVFNRYKGINIANYTLPEANMTISSALLTDLILISNNKGIIQQSIGLYRKHSKDSLLNNKNFQNISAKIKRDALLWGYINNKNYYQQSLREFAGQSLRSREPNTAKFIESFAKMKPFINLMNVLDVSSFYIDYDGLKEGILSKNYQTFNRSLDEDNLVNVLAYNKTVDKNIFNLIPRGIIAYYGGNQDFPGLLGFVKKISLSMEEMFKAQIKNDPRYLMYKDQMDNFTFASIQKKINEFLGISVENDIIPLLGNNFGIVFLGLEDLNMSLGAKVENTALSQKQSPPFLFPQFYSFFELRQAHKMQKVMEGVTQHLVDNINQYLGQLDKIKQQMSPAQKKENIQPVKEKQYLKLVVDEYNGNNICSIDILDFPIGSLKPNYCILDKYIILSLSPALTKKVVDIYKNRQGSLSSDFSFTSVEGNILSDYSNIYFFDVARLVNNIEKTESFKNLKASLYKNKQAQTSTEYLDSVFDILNSIATYSFTNRMIDSQTMESSSYIKIRGL